MSELPPSLGGQVCDWIETYLVHGPGDVQGEPIDLDDELRAFIWRTYELQPDGQRRFRRAFLSRPKGRGKSELAAMLSCAELLGPVRFAGWDANGQPVGRSVTAPEVLCMATEEDQAGFVYLSAKYMLEHGKAADTYPLDTGLTRTYLASGGSLEPVTAAANSKDGGKSTFAVADETHLWYSAELRRLHAMVRRNIVKRKRGDGWMLEISTAYRPGEGSVAEGSHEHAQLVASGEVQDASLLVDDRRASSAHDISTDEGLRAAILEAYGMAAPWTNVEGIISEFHDPQNDEADSRRYWLNQVVAASDQWLSPEQWNACKKKVSIEHGEAIALGFDGSKWEDATALIGCRLSDGHIFTLDIWEKPEGQIGVGWEVPRGEVDAVVHEAMLDYEVRRFYVDPPFWQEELDAWYSEWGDVVVAWWTHRDTQTARALERIHTAVIGQGLTHDGDARVARHVANARIKRVRAGTVIRKEHPKSSKKIDAAMAAALAYEARGDALVAGAGQERSRVPVSL